MKNKNRLSGTSAAFLVMILFALSSCTAVTPTVSPVKLPTPSDLPVQSSETPVPIENPETDTPVSTPDAECDRVQFVMDVTYPDNASVSANETITKKWQVKNVGSCTWNAAYRLVFIRGEQMNGISPLEIISDPVAPGSQVDLAVILKTPVMNGSYWGVWQIYNGAGNPVLKTDGTPQELSILVNVTNGEGGLVTSVRTWSYTFEGVICTSAVQYAITANIYADGAVDVNYTWTVTNGTLTAVSQKYVFSDAGNVAVTTQINPPFTNPNNVLVTLTANGISSSFTICP